MAVRDSRCEMDPPSSLAATFVAPILFHPKGSKRNISLSSRWSRKSVPKRSPNNRSMPQATAKQTSGASDTQTNASIPKPIPNDAVPYFAYFANMNPNKIGPQAKNSARRCELYHSQVAQLPNYDLVFDVPGAPPEPAFANIVEKSSSAVQGVLHWLSPADFRRVALSEGVLRDTPLSLLPPFSSFSNVRTVDVITASNDGAPTTVSAKTFVFNSPVPRLLRSRMRPSRRYVQVALDGAEYWGMDRAYLKKLQAIPKDLGPLGGFGLIVEPRPHLLDRPNSYESFGRISSELYSPWAPIRASSAIKTLEKHDHNTRGKDLRLLRVSNTQKEKASQRKPLYYIPGVDGTGKGILSQVDGLDQEGIYDVSTFMYPFDNRQSLQELACELLDMIRKDSGDKPVTLVGESMGGAVSILLAMENERRLREKTRSPKLNVELLMLINPATSFKRSNPRALWDFLLSLGLSEEVYSQLLPPVLLPFIIDFDAMRNEFSPEIFPRLRKLLFSLAELSDVLPQDALSWRIKLLSEFSVGKDDLKPLGGKFGPSQIAVISSINDNLIPSYAEANRLRRYIPNLYTMVLSYGGHVPSFDSRFSLAGFLKAFNQNSDQQRSYTEPAPPSSSIMKRRESFRKRFGNNHGKQPAEKSYQDLGRLRTFLESALKESSPVFIGTENLPEYDPNRPILFVCNHTLLGWLDAMLPIQKILNERDVLIQALAHPVLFKQVSERPLAFPNTPRVSAEDIDDFGIVQVSPRSLVEQLSGGNWALLFPGGAREALKTDEDEKYSLMWPEDPEFIRACALFGAQIIPISTVGTEDMVRILASPRRVQQAFDIGSRLIRRPIDWEALGAGELPWRGQTSTETGGALVPPFMIPAGSDRIYFKFGKPIDIEEACLTDKRKERQVYKMVQDSVAEGIQVLLQRREFDDYRTIDSRKRFWEQNGENAEPPCGDAWLWNKNGSYLDEDRQPPLN